PREVSMVQLTFDSNFNIEKKIALSSRRQKQQVIGVPPELVRDFTVELLQGEKTVFSKRIEGNWQRLCRVETEKTLCDAVRVRFEATNGCSEARVFEVRLYE
ncbi:MAG: FAD-dependent oxidoreductase, partial [Clostridia bacterium]|nr:FAD-dependent oxidoreductase [Clostridia bacterium]